VPTNAGPHPVLGIGLWGTQKDTFAYVGFGRLSLRPLYVAVAAAAPCDVAGRDWQVVYVARCGLVTLHVRCRGVGCACRCAGRANSLSITKTIFDVEDGDVRVPGTLLLLHALVGLS
jgi:hypothetical protein